MLQGSRLLDRLYLPVFLFFFKIPVTNLDYPDLDYSDLDYPDFSIMRSLSLLPIL